MYFITKYIYSNTCDELVECIGINVFGYEIHNGISSIKEKSEVFIENKDGDVLGLFKENVLGTYLHGIFDEGVFLKTFINSLRKNKGINSLDKELIDYKKYKLNQYDELAILFENNIDLDRIFNK